MSSLRDVTVRGMLHRPTKLPSLAGRGGFAGCDLRFARVHRHVPCPRRSWQGIPLAHCVRHGRGPAVDAGDSAAHCVRSGMAGGAGGNRGEMGGEGKDSGNGTPQPAAHLPFFSPLAAHHSAKRGSVERNLPIYDLKSKVLRLKSYVFILHSPFFILHSQLPYTLRSSCCRCAR